MSITIPQNTIIQHPQKRARKIKPKPTAFKPHELCPCCGFHDLRQHWNQVAGCLACWFTLQEITDLGKYRQRWINDGMKYCTHGTPPPDWDPVQNLARLALKATLSRVKGRPPRMA